MRARRVGFEVAFILLFAIGFAVYHFPKSEGVRASEPWSVKKPLLLDKALQLGTTVSIHGVRLGQPAESLAHLGQPSNPGRHSRGLDGTSRPLPRETYSYGADGASPLVKVYGNRVFEVEGGQFELNGVPAARQGAHREVVLRLLGPPDMTRPSGELVHDEYYGELKLGVRYSGSTMLGAWLHDGIDWAWQTRHLNDAPYWPRPSSDFKGGGEQQGPLPWAN